MQVNIWKISYLNSGDSYTKTTNIKPKTLSGLGRRSACRALHRYRKGLVWDSWSPVFVSCSSCVYYCDSNWCRHIFLRSSTAQTYDLSYTDLHSSFSSPSTCILRTLSVTSWPSWLDGSIGKALHWYQRLHEFTSFCFLWYFVICFVCCLIEAVANKSSVQGSTITQVSSEFSFPNLHRNFLISLNEEEMC